MSKSWESMKEEARKKATHNEEVYHGCGQSTLNALQEVLGIKNDELFKSATALQGGIAFEGQYCGALLCGMMILGIEYGRVDLKEGFPGIIRGVIPANRLVERYRKEFGTHVCRDVLAKVSKPGSVAYGAAPPSAQMLKYMRDNPQIVEKRIKELDMHCSKITGWVAEAVVDIMSELEKEGYKKA